MTKKPRKHHTHADEPNDPFDEDAPDDPTVEEQTAEAPPEPEKVKTIEEHGIGAQDPYPTGGQKNG
jgi:hypothetical protein